ncbi:MAG: restriction endonuclease [Burkholderiaceae bacterium]
MAAFAYAVLHRVATQTFVPSAAPGEIQATVFRGMSVGLASVGQFLLPLVCLLGAAISAFKRHQRCRLLGEVTHNEVGPALAHMNWREFELLISEAFRTQGYRVEQSGGGGADGGVDLVLSRGGEIHLVQCKHWRAYKVGVDVVRELYGVMTARGAAAGFVVTSGSFTPAASEFTSGRNLTLIDGSRLGAMIKKAQASQAAPKQSAPSISPAVPPRRPSEPPTRSVPISATPTPVASPKQAAAPLCPRCGSSMVGRTARRGASAGAGFWGCSGYPACRGTRPID